MNQPGAPPPAPPASPADPVREGEILAGKYRVDRVLGAGGMGVVVAATHLQLDQRFALKFVLPSLTPHAGTPGASEHNEALERFAREARAAVKLKSEHVARVHDVGTLENGAPYMVMEYLEGRDLGAEIDQRGPMPFAEAADYVLQACEAIAEAHALGIVHRDLKPQNMFLTRRVDGNPLVKVLDFGISKLSGQPGLAPGSAPGGAPALSLTKTHAVMGSPNYMSPEQLRSARGVDARTDIWALGVILYELLTGRVPFIATSVTELCAMVLQDTPRPLRETRPDVPEGLVDVVSRCLEKDPVNRFQSIASLAHALEPFAAGRSAGAAQRILAVARESSARGLGLPAGGTSSQQVVAMSASGKTSVSWAATELAKPPRRAMLPFVLLGGLGAVILLAAGSIVAWKVVVPRYRHAPNALTTSVAAPAQSPPPATPEPAPPAPPAPPASSAAPPAPPPTSSAAPAASAHGGRPAAHPNAQASPKPNARRNPDQDTPDERN